MSEPQTRPPTPAVSRVSPIYQFANGTLYPYWNLKQSGITPYLEAARRAFASINPFSHQQVPTSERMGLNIKFGRKYYREEPYPNSAHFDSKYPSHYDALKDERFKPKAYSRHFHGTLDIQIRPIVPRFCERELRKYKRCLISNDSKEEICKQEQDNIIAVCPQWALHNLKEKKLGLLKSQALANKKYKEVMDVPFYNKGRTVADVPLKRWEDGSRENLRPDTLWADDRYADITQEQINAAKERVKKRRQAHPAQKVQLPHYDRKFQVPPRQTPLYSV